MGVVGCKGNGAMVCQAGAPGCLAWGSIESCDDLDPCTQDLCVETRGCQHTASAGAWPCDDGSACTTGDHCEAGQCTGGACVCGCCELDDCPDDGDLCNGLPFCDLDGLLGPANTCQTDPATIVSCGPAVEPCLVQRCAPATGDCEAVPADNGTACDDGLFCNGNDICSEGACVPDGSAPCAAGGICDESRSRCDTLCPQPVNASTQGSQREPMVAFDGAGSFVVVWQSASEGSESDIYARRFDSRGHPTGDEFRVNTHTAGDQRSPAIAARDNGDFVVAWQSDGQDGHEGGIFARRYSGSTPQSAEFQVNSHWLNTQAWPDVAMAADGAFVVVWASWGQDDVDPEVARWDVHGQRYEANGSPAGGEFLVNETVPGEQVTPRVAVDSQGNFAVAWQAADQDGAGMGVFARRFTAAGAAVGGEFQVNVFTDADQDYPDIGMAPDGEFVIAWRSSAQDGSGSGVYLRRFDASGAALSEEVMVPIHHWSDAFGPQVAVADAEHFVVTFLYREGTVNQLYARRFDLSAPLAELPFPVGPSLDEGLGFGGVAVRSNGDAVIVFEEKPDDIRAKDIYLGLYPAEAAPACGQFPVHSYSNDNQENPVVAMADAGNFVVAWESQVYGGRWNVLFQRYDAGGLPLGANTPAYPDAGSNGRANPAIAMNGATGAFVVIATGDDATGPGIRARRFDSGGGPLGDESTVFEGDSDSSPVVAMSDAGAFVVAWAAADVDGAGTGVVARRFDQAGQPLGAEFQVNTFTTGDQTDPAVAMNAEGAFVVAWTSFYQDGSEAGVAARVFGADGAPAGSDFVVNDYVPDWQGGAAVAMLDSGAFAVVWQGNGPDAPSEGQIYLRLFAAGGGPVGGSVRVNEEIAGTHSAPAIAGSAAGGFLVCWEDLLVDGHQLGIAARRFDIEGVALGDSFAVNKYTLSSQTYPAIAGAATGRFVVVWESAGQDCSGDGVFAQLLDEQGRLVSCP